MLQGTCSCSCMSRDLASTATCLWLQGLCRAGDRVASSPLQGARCSVAGTQSKCDRHETMQEAVTHQYAERPKSQSFSMASCVLSVRRKFSGLMSLQQEKYKDLSMPTCLYHTFPWVCRVASLGQNLHVPTAVGTPPDNAGVAPPEDCQEVQWRESQVAMRRMFR